MPHGGHYDRTDTTGSRPTRCNKHLVGTRPVASSCWAARCTSSDGSITPSSLTSNCLIKIKLFDKDKTKSWYRWLYRPRVATSLYCDPITCSKRNSSVSRLSLTVCGRCLRSSAEKARLRLFIISCGRSVVGQLRQATTFCSPVHPLRHSAASCKDIVKVVQVLHQDHSIKRR